MQPIGPSVFTDQTEVTLCDSGSGKIKPQTHTNSSEWRNRPWWCSVMLPFISIKPSSNCSQGSEISRTGETSQFTLLIDSLIRTDTHCICRTQLMPGGCFSRFESCREKLLGCKCGSARPNKESVSTHKLKICTEIFGQHSAHKAHSWCLETQYSLF